MAPINTCFSMMEVVIDRCPHRRSSGPSTCGVRRQAARQHVASHTEWLSCIEVASRAGVCARRLYLHRTRDTPACQGRACRDFFAIGVLHVGIGPARDAERTLDGNGEALRHGWIPQMGCDLICGSTLIDPDTLFGIAMLGSLVVTIALIGARYISSEPPPPPACREAYWLAYLAVRRPDLTIEECSRMGRILAVQEIASGTENIASRLTTLMEQYPPEKSSGSWSR